jgi:AbiV family abortive infection protein
MRKPKSAQPLSLDEIAAFRVKLLENAAALISDADLLFAHGRYPRCFALCVIAMEETSKVTILLNCAEAIVAAQPLDWSNVHTSLVSHADKLMENLLNAKRLQSDSKFPVKGTRDWEDAVARVREMNLFKQDGLYASVEGGVVSTPDEKVATTFSRERTDMAIALAKNSYNRADLAGRGFDAKRLGLTSVDLRVRFPTSGV